MSDFKGYKPIEVARKKSRRIGDSETDVTLVLSTCAKSIYLRGKLAESEFSSKKYVCMFDRFNKKMALKLAKPNEEYAFEIQLAQQGYVRKSSPIADEILSVGFVGVERTDVNTTHYEGKKALADDGSPVWVFDLSKGKEFP